ncbi:MAG: L-threonylcarbamoyladenylate synthase [Candidatus Woesebacteria bacterium]|nr:L-threonylcarbamoyladenylate synthase [Candidatus Woesebacteria bacterium]
MKIIKQSNKVINIVVKALNDGQLVFLASETVYVAAVDATNENAVKKLVTFKNRPFGKPFSVGVTDIKMAEKYVVLNETARNLYKRFLPGPVTVISTGKHNLAKGVEAENGTLGIRIPDYPFFQKVCKKLAKPITATSANASYQKRPYKLADILDNISKKQKKLIDLMIDAGKLPHNEPSTVIDTTLDDKPIILRQGEIKLKKKNEVLSRSGENTQNIAKELWQKYDSFVGNRAIIFALEGKMGTGKTQFVKGLAKAMGIKEKISSPSYDLLNSYDLLTHIDTWRMINPNKELKDLGTKKLIHDKSVLAIEWADRTVTEIKKYSEEAIIIWVKIKYGKETNDRLISWGIT